MSRELNEDINEEEACEEEENNTHVPIQKLEVYRLYSLSFLRVTILTLLLTELILL